jgi:hypothetical protein
MSYEITIPIESERQEEYKDDLILALVNCGYAVWLEPEGGVVYIAPDMEVRKQEEEAFR